MASIRDAKESDVHSIWRVHTESISKICNSHYSASDIETWAARQDPEKYITFIREDTFIVAQAEVGTILGFGHMALSRSRDVQQKGSCSSNAADNGITMEIKGLYVSPESSGNGIGKMLLMELERRAKLSGSKALMLASTLNAVGFYERCGFSVSEQSTHCVQCTSGHHSLQCTTMRKMLATA